MLNILLATSALIFAKDHNFVCIVDIRFHECLLLQWTAINYVDVLELGDRAPYLRIDLVTCSAL